MTLRGKNCSICGQEHANPCVSCDSSLFAKLRAMQSKELSESLRFAFWLSASTRHSPRKFQCPACTTEAACKAPGFSRNTVLLLTVTAVLNVSMWLWVVSMAVTCIYGVFQAQDCCIAGIKTELLRTQVAEFSHVFPVLARRKPSRIWRRQPDCQQKMSEML